MADTPEPIRAGITLRIHEGELVMSVSDGEEVTLIRQETVEDSGEGVHTSGMDTTAISPFGPGFALVDAPVEISDWTCQWWERDGEFRVNAETEHDGRTFAVHGMTTTRAFLDDAPNAADLLRDILDRQLTDALDD